jgi:hypothetical protein
MKIATSCYVLVNLRLYAHLNEEVREEVNILK